MGEMEFLFEPFSVFKASLWRAGEVMPVRTRSVCRVAQVVSTDFTPRDFSKTKSHYTIIIEAAIDNDMHGLDLPLAPWS